jgi:predicted DNA-binding transcriptional regulator AlpA
MSSPAQNLFDNTYITSYEICKTLGIERSTLLRARARNKLPEPILIPGVNAYIWERNKVAAAIDQWKESLTTRRGQ